MRTDPGPYDPAIDVHLRKNRFKLHIQVYDLARHADALPLMSHSSPSFSMLGSRSRFTRDKALDPALARSFSSIARARARIAFSSASSASTSSPSTRDRSSVFIRLRLGPASGVPESDRLARRLRPERGWSLAEGMIACARRRSRWTASDVNDPTKRMEEGYLLGGTGR